MVRVTLELESAVDESRNRHLGTLTIANDGKGTSTRGNYTVKARVGNRGRERWAKVRKFPRHSRNALELLRRALNALHEAKQL